MGIGLIIRRLLTKDKVDPNLGDSPDLGDSPVFRPPPHFGPHGEQVHQDSSGTYYVDDHGERHEWWIPPWSENPS